MPQMRSGPPPLVHVGLVMFAGVVARDGAGLRGRRGILAVDGRIFSGLSAVLFLSAAVLCSGAGASRASDERPARVAGGRSGEFRAVHRLAPEHCGTRP